MKRTFIISLATFACLANSVPAAAVPAINFPAFPAEQGTASTSTPAQNAATSKPVLGEIVGRRSQNSRTFRNGNGTVTTRISSEPINFKDNQGKWQVIDSHLTNTTEAGYAWRNAANRFAALFKNQLGNDYFRFDLGGQTYLFTLQGAARVQARATAFGLTYANALAGTDLSYSMVTTGVKETMTLQSAGSPSNYHFTLTPPAGATLQAKQLPDGSWGFFTPRFGDPVFILVAPRASDAPIPVDSTSPSAKLSPQTAGPSSAASMAVTRVGGQFAIDIKLDPQWLHDPGRRFPVTLDPTITVQPDTQDAIFVNNCPGCAGYQGDHLVIGTNSKYAYRSAVQFDLSSLPAGQAVASAQLGLFYDATCIVAKTFCTGVLGSSHPMDVHRMTAAWSPASTTSQIGYDSTVLSTYTLTSPSANTLWMTWDVTATVQNWLSGAQPNDGLYVNHENDIYANLSGPAPVSSLYAGDPTIAPELNVTYNSDAVTLLAPSTLHSNGADLSWSAYTGPSGAAFQKYEIHRSLTGNFTPSKATLLAAITDPSVTTYRDTTAAPSRAFYYAIVANSSKSNEVAVTLPSDGNATKLLQPGPATGKDTFVYGVTGNCANYGADQDLWVGADKYGVLRSFLQFDLRDIPTSATINSATLSLFHNYGASSSMTLRAYRVTHAWNEGTGITNPAACTGDGATWYESNGGTTWTNQGGDYDSSTSYGVVSVLSGESARWHSYDVSGLVQKWANGSAPNLGLMLRADSEVTQTGNNIIYYSDDYAAQSTLRPKLSITYVDNSHAIAPTVSVSAPAANSVVMGGTVTLSAAASDDRRVDHVDFFIDGSLVGTAGSAPYAVTWNSTPVANGNHTVTARAYDDALNSTTSAGVSITVANFAVPATSVTAPASNATVSGTTTVSATGSAAGGLSQVEFYFDNTRFATVTAPPFNASWNTLDSTSPAYDGSHVLTTRAYDSYGQVTTSTGVTVNVANTGGTQYQASWSSSAYPQAVLYDPSASTQATYGINVTVTNTSALTWNGSVVTMNYEWISPDATPVITYGTAKSVGTTVAPNGQATLQFLVTPPTLADAVDQALYTLRFDLFDSSSGSSVSFASKGNGPLDGKVAVRRALAAALGLEKYYQYIRQSVGPGWQHLVNVANGNSILHWEPYESPGRGLATLVGVTYNSLENHSDSPLGNNFSLSMSTLTRFGLPLEIHPSNADTIAGNPKRWIAFVDGDGTPHRFDGFQAPDGTINWVEPPGVHLYLRQFSTTDTTRWWAFTRPDRTTWFYNQAGFPTSIQDRNGNAITFTETAVSPDNNFPGGPAYQITQVTDAGGRSFTISYYTKADAKKAHQRGRVKSIRDHVWQAGVPGHEIDFTYYEDGNLLGIIQRGGTNGDGSFLADRSLIFTYTTSDGSGPAITDPTARANPDPRTPNESTRLYSVRDPNGHETTFAYLGPGNGQDRWKLASYATRDGKPTSFAYNDIGQTTTVTAPLSRTTTYSYDGDGKVTTIVDPLQQPTQIQWSADFAVTRITEANGKATNYVYNDNGYMTDKYDQLSNHTVLTYQNLQVDANDVSGKWSTIGATGIGRTIPHISQLATKQDPLQVAANIASKWTFSYDGNGNVTQVTDPLNNSSSNTYNSDGTLNSTKDANGHMTTFGTNYDANGLPTLVIDATDNPSAPVHPMRIGYDANGLMRWVQDANHAGALATDDARQFKIFYDYDSFNRLGRQTMPKQYVPNEVGPVIELDTVYDPNDNVLGQMAPHYQGKPADTTTIAYDVMDRRSQTTNPDISFDTSGERTQYQYDDAGRLIKVTLPMGVYLNATNNTFTVDYSYDPLDRVIGQTRNHADSSGTVHALTQLACYDSVGNLVSSTAPNAGLSSVTCPATTATPNTTVYSYDADHRVLTTTDPDNHTSSVGYDANGNTTTKTDANGFTTKLSYDLLNRMVREDDPLLGPASSVSRYLTSESVYDAVGNVMKSISPRAYDASSDKVTFTSFVTAYQYDAVNRLVRTDLPIDTTSSNPNFTTPYYMHRAYDAAGNVLWSSLPDTMSSPSQVPASDKTAMTYFDPGWVATSQDPGNPRVHFDYTPKGEQSTRTPENALGQLDLSKQITWSYYADGQLNQRIDNLGQPITNTYNADNVLIKAVEASGLTGTAGPITAQVTVDDLDRTMRVDQQNNGTGNWTFTNYTYDSDNNVVATEQNGSEASPNAVATDSGRKFLYEYDSADRLKDQCLLSSIPNPASCMSSTSANDILVMESFSANGQELQRQIQEGNGANGWNPKETTSWSYLDNGKLANLTITNGGPTAPTVQSDLLCYIATTDTACQTGGTYLDGNRISDQFSLKGSTSTVSGTANYSYDPRDRLVSTYDGHSTTTNYSYQAPGQTSASAGLDPHGNISLETYGSTTKQYQYTGDQLQSITTNGAQVKYFYDDAGRQWCTTTSAGSSSDCATAAATTSTGTATTSPSTSTASVSANLLTLNKYDYLDRLASARTYSGGAQTDSANYTYDALDRTTNEIEQHPNQAQRTTAFVYAGMSGQDIEEQISSSSGNATKDFVYDAYGHLMAMINTPAGQAAQTYTYGSNVHSSISLLLDSSGNTRASYGYRPYGDPDTGLTQGDTDLKNMFNPFRYDAKRFDSGSQSLDTGARRFSSDAAHFMQPDRFFGALGNLGLSLDPLTQNRYGLAGGNPLSFIEWDGHLAVADGGGGGAASPNPVSSTTSSNTSNANHSNPVGDFFNAVGQKANQAKDFVVDNGTKAVNWVVDNSSTISAVTGTLAIVVAPIPGLDALTPVLAGVSIATAAIATAKDVKQGNYGSAAMDALGVIPGAGEAAAALKDARLGVNLVKDAAKAEQVGRATSDAANISRASASGITKGLATEGAGGLEAAAVNGETAATAAGRAAHTAMNYGEGFQKEFTLPSGSRVDAVNFEDRIVLELKPNNMRAINRGLNQVDRYVDELNREFPGETPWQGQVVTYGG